MDPATQVIHPFRGIRYSAAEAGNLSALLAPPYDIITAEMQGDLYARHPHGFVRLELARENGSDTEDDNRYTRTAADLRDWLAEGVLIREERPALYVVETEFRLGGRVWRRRGVFAAVRLPEPGERYVLEHEDTFAPAKQDRLRLMQATQAMISPTMSMCEDADGRLLSLLHSLEAEPEAVAEMEDMTHRMWVVREEAGIAALRAAAGAGPLYLADGHHRFLTARRYRDEMRGKLPAAPATAGFNYALMLLVSARDEAVKILPSHRLVSGLNLEGVAWAESRMADYFEIQAQPAPSRWRELEVRLLTETARPHRHTYYTYSADGAFAMLVARDELRPVSDSPVDQLDVTVLHDLLVDPMIKCDPARLVDPDQMGRCVGPRLSYTVDVPAAAAGVARGEHEFAFFLRPTKVAEVVAVARAGERMPHKSTYFYPKVPAGLVLSDASAEPIG